jgi:hypothetical protein
VINGKRKRTLIWDIPGIRARCMRRRKRGAGVEISGTKKKKGKTITSVTLTHASRQPVSAAVCCTSGK